jgi:N-carbamoyl-L-amino-acid hydrolase
MRGTARQASVALRSVAAIAIALSTVGQVIAAQESAPLRADPHRILAHIEGLSRFGRNAEGGVDRVAYSEADIQGREYVKELMREAGLAVVTDTAGNIIGRREGSDPGLAPILFGSHIDSVPGGGNYDGDVGVMGAIEAAQLLHEAGVVTRHPLEVVVFADEEGGLNGSRAMVGDLTPEALQVVSHSGLTVGEGIRALGGDPESIEEARRPPGAIRAFLELHIEQGGTLGDKSLDIGVVEGIVGISWWEVTIEGMANHAGTTPMAGRKDALVAASHLIIGVSRIALERPGRHVATVGRISADPGAPNVIPGKVVMSLEVRDLDSRTIQELFTAIAAYSGEVANKTGTRMSWRKLATASTPAPTDEGMRDLIEASAKELGLTTLRMPSGAGHDAQDLARITPTGMIFVPSRGGISHSPKEYTSPEDMANGASVLLRTILKIDLQ